jgi:hypothetical protein
MQPLQRGCDYAKDVDSPTRPAPKQLSERKIAGHLIGMEAKKPRDLTWSDIGPSSWL